MLKQKNYLHFLFISIFLFFCRNIEAQYLFSTLSNGQSAFLASNLPGHSFIANPAYLGNRKFIKKLHLKLDVNTSGRIYLNPLESEIPDFELWLPIKNKYCFALRKQTGFPEAGLGYLGKDYLVSFRYNQGWSYGFGIPLKKHISIGLSIKHIKYTQMIYTKSSKSPDVVKNEFIDFEIGSLFDYWRPLKLAIVLRDFFPLRLNSNKAILLPEYKSIYYEPFCLWEPTPWQPVSTKPVPHADFGISYLFKNSVELLFDYSTRKEYAWGLCIHFSKAFSIFGGKSNRYDNVFNESPYKTASIGLHIHYKFIILVVSGVWHQEGKYSPLKLNKYGKWSTSQHTHDSAMFSLGIAF